MPRHSGFAAKITAFLPANAKDAASMQRALDNLKSLSHALSCRGYLAVSVESRFMLSKEVKASPSASGPPAQHGVAEEPEAAKSSVPNGDASALAEIGEQVREAAGEPIPPFLDRRRA